MVAPIPDCCNFDFVTVIVFILFLFLILDFTSVFLKVAINFAGLLVPKPLIVTVVPPLPNTNLSALSASVVPSVLIRTYLSSSKGKKVSKAEPEETAPVELEAMSTSNCFLIVKVESVKSTEATFCFGRTVNKVLSNPSWKLEDKIVKSLGLISELGRPPSQTSVTLVIPVKVRLC